MTISSGTMGAIIGRLMVENAINNKNSAELIREASHEAEIAMLEIDGANVRMANQLASAKGVIEIANSAVKAGRAAENLGSEVDVQSQRAEAMPQLEHGLDRQDAGAGLDDIGNVRLGDDGPLVRDRFNPEQLDVLTNSERINEMYDQNLQAQTPPGSNPDAARDATMQQLKDMGFSDGEAAQLMRDGRGAGGLSNDEAAKFMWDNRKTEAEKMDEYFSEKLYDAIQDISGQALGVGLDHAAQKAREEGGRAKDAMGDIEAVGDEAWAMAVDHQQAIDDILTDGLKQADDPNKGNVG